MNYSTKFDKLLPPCTHQVLKEHLPDGFGWYEVRSYGNLLSFSLADWDPALSTGKAFNRIYPSGASFFYCWKENGEIHEERIL
jgi:hypothetical protein